MSEWKAGDRIILVRTDDPHTKLVPGDVGSVTGYDPCCEMLHVKWDSGSTLSMLLADGDKVLWAGYRREKTP
jgi:Domain of unknown function (DUF4314)